jgi:hypothetical protein
VLPALLAAPILFSPNRLWSTRFIWWQDFDADRPPSSNWRKNLIVVLVGLVIPTFVVGALWWRAAGAQIMPIVREFPEMTDVRNIEISGAGVVLTRLDGTKERRAKVDLSLVNSWIPPSRVAESSTRGLETASGIATVDSLAFSSAAELGAISGEAVVFGRLTWSGEFRSEISGTIYSSPPVVLRAAHSRETFFGPPSPFLTARDSREEKVRFFEPGVAISPWPRNIAGGRGIVHALAVDPFEEKAVVAGDFGIVVVDLSAFWGPEEYFVYEPPPVDTRPQEFAERVRRFRAGIDTLPRQWTWGPNRRVGYGDSAVLVGAKNDGPKFYVLRGDSGGRDTWPISLQGFRTPNSVLTFTVSLDTTVIVPRKEMPGDRDRVRSPGR